MQHSEACRAMGQKGHMPLMKKELKFNGKDFDEQTERC